MEEDSLTIDFNKTKDKKIKVFCSQCNGDTNHLVLQSVDTSESHIIAYDDEAGPITIGSWDKYQTIQCQGCDCIIFRHVSWFSEDPDEPSIHLYPKHPEKTRPIKNYYNIPIPLRQIYRETIDCFNQASLILCAAGLRAMIEGICSDQKINDGPVEVKNKDGNTQTKRLKNLEGKIAGLCEKGILTQANTLILHEHRYLGNNAIHELDQPSIDELTLAIDIMEHVLDDLYELPRKAGELRRIKEKRLNKQKISKHLNSNK